MFLRGLIEGEAWLDAELLVHEIVKNPYPGERFGIPFDRGYLKELMYQLMVFDIASEDEADRKMKLIEDLKEMGVDTEAYA